MRWYKSILILIAISSLLPHCNTEIPATSIEPDITANWVKDSVDETFLGNCKQLQATDGFRQNIWLTFNKDGHGAICMDLDHQLYLVVDTELPIRSVEYLNNLRITAAALRKRMDPDAFILDGDEIDLIFRIPPNAEESFAAELFNQLLGLKLETHDIGYHWD